MRMNLKKFSKFLLFLGLICYTAGQVTKSFNEYVAEFILWIALICFVILLLMILLLKGNIFIDKDK